MYERKTSNLSGTTAINQYLYSDGSGSYTPVKRPDGSNYVPPCSTFKGISGWDRSFTALARNSRVLVAARWIESGCDLLIGSVPGVGAAWLKGGFTRNETVVCNDGTAKNYGQVGDCVFPIKGCRDGYANNFNPLAEIADNSQCTYDSLTCWDGSTINPQKENCPTRPRKNCWDGSTIYADQSCPTRPTKVCWNGSTIYADQNCPTRSTKVCWNGSTIYADQTCPTRSTKVCRTGQTVYADQTCPTPSFNQTVFNNLFNQYLGQAIGLVVGDGAAKPVDSSFKKLVADAKGALSGYICADKKSISGGIC
jgi:hypothetical protein